jgi:CheY-like chemotaxis protein
LQYSCISATALLPDEQASLSEAVNSIHPPYVLTIDDDKAIVDVIQSLLETEGYNGFGISDSLKVLSFLTSLQDSLLPSVILLDLMMPGLSGYEIARILTQSERYKHIPIIVMTADSRVQSIDAIQGAIGFVAKPFRLDPLLAKLKAYLGPPTL